MNVGRSVAAGVSLALVAGAAWWTMSDLDVGPAVPAATSGGATQAASPPAPDTRPSRPAPAPFVLPAARPQAPPLQPDALSRADEQELEATAPSGADEAHFQAVAQASMAAKLTAVSNQFGDAVRSLQGTERQDVKRVLDDAYGEMRDIAEQLKQGELDIGAAFGEVERVRDRAGRELDATLPAGRAAEVKAAAGVRAADEAAAAVDWGIPVDEATADEVFKER